MSRSTAWSTPTSPSHRSTRFVWHSANSLNALPYDIWLTAEFSPRTVAGTAQPMADDAERADGHDG